MQCKDIPVGPILKFLEYCATAQLDHGDGWATWEADKNGSLFSNSVQHAMPAGVTPMLARAKMENLIERGLVEGCTCGCQGDYELTSEGLAYINSAKFEADSALQE